MYVCIMLALRLYCLFHVIWIAIYTLQAVLTNKTMSSKNGGKGVHVYNVISINQNTDLY